jgi:hypothetical protein
MPIMHDLLFRATLLMALAGMGASPAARADVFTWVDKSGRVNVSNLDPPADAHVTSVVHVNAPKVTPAAADAARESRHQAEVAALAEQVRQLQDEVKAAQRPPPAPQPRYRVAAVPRVPYAAGDWAPDASPYAYAASPAPAPDCDPSWAGCAPFWGPGFATSIIVLRAPCFNRFSPSRGHRAFAPRPPRRNGGGRMR